MNESEFLIIVVGVIALTSMICLLKAMKVVADAGTRRDEHAFHRERQMAELLSCAVESRPQVAAIHAQEDIGHKVAENQNGKETRRYGPSPPNTASVHDEMAAQLDDTFTSFHGDAT